MIKNFKLIIQPIENPNKPIYRAFFGIYILTSLISLILIPIIGISLYIILPGIFASGFFLAGIILFFSGKNLVPQIQSILKDEYPTIKWELDKFQTEIFAEQEFKRLTEDGKLTFWVFVLVGILAAFIGIIPLSIFFGALLGAILGFLAYFISYINAKHLKVKYSEQPLQVIISPIGILLNGVYHTWNIYGRELLNVEFNETSKTLKFEYSSARVSKSGVSKSVRTVFVPVPDDKIEVVHQFLNTALS